MEITAKTKSGISFQVEITWSSNGMGYQHVAILGEERVFCSCRLINEKTPVVWFRKGVQSKAITSFLGVEIQGDVYIECEDFRPVYSAIQKAEAERYNEVPENVKIMEYMGGRSITDETGNRFRALDELQERIQNVSKALKVWIHTILEPFHVRTDSDMTTFYEGSYEDLVTHVENMESLIEVQEPENTEADAINQAIQSGKPVEISRDVEITPTRNGEMYATYTKWAMPDGTTKITSSETEMS